MEPIKIGTRVIPLGHPPRMDTLSLLESFVANQHKPAALTRLKMATIGLCWYAAYDAMPNRTPADKAERAGSVPPFKRLEDCEYDLMKFGNNVGDALGDAALIEARVKGDEIAVLIFKDVVPDPSVVDQARGNLLGELEPTSANSSV